MILNTHKNTKRKNAKTRKTVVIANHPHLEVSQLNFCGLQTEVRVALSRFAGGGPIFFFSAVVVEFKLFSAVVVEKIYPPGMFTLQTVRIKQIVA
jgi:hypothetical protein